MKDRHSLADIFAAARRLSERDIGNMERAFEFRDKLLAMAEREMRERPDLLAA